ncbi:MAG TPA: hypothetical protein VK742_12325 [Candidatus Sulfotelmatobacter sp.]|nr:hypothetical protein [Candidatus Sulfotelmatobacter sp.]
MSGSLKKSDREQHEQKVCEATDVVLGKLKLSEEGWWEARVAIGGKSVGFKIGGSKEPDANLIAHARDIVGTFAAFEKMVAEFLLLESKRLAPLTHEIQKLTINDVMLAWPKRPNDGMIFFSGIDEYRIWRCDYSNRKPQGLGFDD